jgi:CBS domain-containing protein
MSEGMTLLPFCKPVVELKADATIMEAARRMRDEHVGCIVVTRAGRPIGLLTDRDLVIRALAEGASGSAEIHGFITHDPMTLATTESLESAVSMMKEFGVRRLPLVDAAGRIAGMVTADDLLAAFGRELGRLCEGIADNTDGDDSR